MPSPAQQRRSSARRRAAALAGGMLLAAFPGVASAPPLPPAPAAAHDSPATAVSAPRPLGPRGLANLAALTALLGDVRYFHPSSEAAVVDWNRFTILAVAAVEPAADAAALRQVLERLFLPIAPTLKLFPAGEPPPPFTPVSAPGARLIAWRHYGLGTGTPKSGLHFDSRRVGGFEPWTGRGQALKRIDLTPAPGESLRLAVAARAEPGEPAGGGAEIFLTLDDVQGKPLAAQQLPVTSNRWQRYELTAAIPAAARRATLGLRLTGGGAAWLDDVRLEAAAAAGGARTLLADGFETAEPGASSGLDREPVGWIVPTSSREAGFHVEITADAPYAGARSLCIARRQDVDLPDPARPLLDQLGGGVAALVPLALYADSTGTLPHAPPAPAASAGGAEPRTPKPTTSDRSTRLADVVLLSAAFERFYPHFADVAAAWPAVRARALREAAEDPSARAFVDTLRRLVAGLADGHAEVADESDNADFRLPLAWDWIDGQLVISWVEPSAVGVAPGDIVQRIDGRPAAAALAALLPLAPGATEGFRRAWALEQLATGEQGTAHELDLLDRRLGQGRSRVVRLTCTANRYGPQRFLVARHPKVQELRPGVFYVDLTRIDDTEFKTVQPRLLQARAVVFDMRGYPESISPDLFLAHLIDHPVAIRDAVVVRGQPCPPGTPAGHAPDRLDPVVWRIEPVAPRFAGPVAFLTDATAISRAEAELSFVQDGHLAAIVGAPTAGTRGEVDEIDLPGETTQVFWTGTLALNADGTPYHGRGITPTIAVQPTAAGLTAGRDEVLEAAVTALLGH